MPTKTPAKAPAGAPKAPKEPGATKTVPKKAPEKLYTMPQEVSDWIERAQSIMNHQKGEIERLKRENAELRGWRKWAEHRILRSEHED